MEMRKKTKYEQTNPVLQSRNLLTIFCYAIGYDRVGVAIELTSFPANQQTRRDCFGPAQKRDTRNDVVLKLGCKTNPKRRAGRMPAAHKTALDTTRRRPYAVPVRLKYEPK